MGTVAGQAPRRRLPLRCRARSTQGGGRHVPRRGAPDGTGARFDAAGVRGAPDLNGKGRQDAGGGLTTPPPKLRREWTAKLAAAGFEDLESSRDPDGPLSDRGNLHPVEHTQAEERRLVERMEDGSDYQSWARDILHRGRWRNATERRIWELHCDGMATEASPPP